MQRSGDSVHSVVVVGGGVVGIEALLEMILADDRWNPFF
jgi:NADH dehydrogenase FAD-containing subunit